MATPSGRLKLAARPTPLALPLALVPARVVTAALAITSRRSTWLLCWVKYTLAPSVAIAAGYSRRASAPTPSTVPAARFEPTSVLTWRVAITMRRIAWLPLSPT